MIIYNLKLIFRHFLRNKTVSLFSILGLSLGFAVFLYVFMYIRFENSYDKHLKDFDKTYRLHVNANTIQWARSLFFLGSSLQQKYAGIDDVTSFLYSEQNTIVDPQLNIPIEVKHIMCVDSNFIDFYGFTLISGRKQDIGLPNTAIVTTDFAAKYFGNENPIGKELDVKSIQYSSPLGRFTIVGLIEKPAANTHFTFSVLLSQKGNLDARIKFLKESAGCGSYTYLKINNRNDVARVEQYIQEILEENQANFWGPPLSSFIHRLQPVGDIYRKSNLGHELKPTNSGKLIFILGSVGVLILIISLVNFIILHSTRIMNRGKEIAFRKISGANNISLIKYFCLESFIYSIISIYLATVFIELIRPLVKRYFEIDFPLIYGNITTFLFVILLIIFTIFIFNLFILFLIRKIRVINAFKLGMVSNTGGEFFRKILTIIQLACATGLLIFTIAVNKQLNYLQNKNLGFNSDNILVLTCQDNNTSQDPFLIDLQTIPSVANVSRCQQYPGYPMNIMGFPLPTGEGFPVKLTTVDENYFNTMGLEIIKQFDYPDQRTEPGIYINEKMYNTLFVAFNNDLDRLLTHPFNVKILGVFKDFHFASLHSEIEPFFFFNGKTDTKYRFILISINPVNLKSTLKEIEYKWNKYYPEQHFDYFFLNDKLNNQYKSEFMVFLAIKSVIAIMLVVLSMGLIGTISFAMDRRQREIAVRKIMGASIKSLLKKYVFKFTSTVIISFVLIMPVMYFVLEKWYSNFKYHTPIQYSEFFLGGIFILIYTWIIIIWIILKNIRKNPVESLRYE